MRAQALACGDRPRSDETRTGVLRDMARVFVDGGYVHIADGEYEGVQHRDRAVEEIARSLAHTIAHWDHFVGIRRTLTRPVIALRAAAFDLWFGWYPPPEARGMTFDDAPARASDESSDGHDRVLRALSRAGGPGSLIADDSATHGAGHA